jgi:hypothetical protein
VEEAVKIQITLMDDRDYILDYKDVRVDDPRDDWQTESYVAKALQNPEVVKIHIRKWEN